MPVYGWSALCTRHGVRSLWAFGEGGHEFAVEFLTRTNRSPHGRVALLQLELEFQVAGRPSVVDLALEDDPAVIQYIFSTRRRLYTPES